MGIGSEASLKLQATAKAVDLNRVGFISLHKQRYISNKLLSKLVETGVAQALLDNISNTSLGLLVRSLFPLHDFCHGPNESAITGWDWIMPMPINKRWPQAQAWEFKYTHGKTSGGVLQSNVEVYTGDNWWLRQAYCTNRHCDNDRKIYCIIGFADVNFPEEECWVSHIRINRANIKTVDYLDLSHIKDRGVVFCQRPILAKRSDDMIFDFILKKDALGHSDKLAPVGFVVEGLGAIMTG